MVRFFSVDEKNLNISYELSIYLLLSDRSSIELEAHSLKNLFESLLSDWYR